MAATIDPRAVVDPGARVGDRVEIGPFCVVGPNVTIGAGTRLAAHVSVAGHTTIGEDNRISPFASLGGPPQDLKYGGEPTRLEIGHRNVIRESVTCNRGTTGGGGLTSIGDDNLFMAYAHVAHDCRVGSRTIFANAATLAGHVEVADEATVEAFSGIHQFCRVARAAFIGGYSVLTQDALPWVLTVGNRAASHGVNLVGLKRKGLLGDDLTLIGHSQDCSEAVPGQVMLITLGWQPRRRPQSNYIAHLELVALEGQVIMQWQFTPGGDHYPSSRWTAGQVTRSQSLIRIPGRAQSGAYQWRVTLFDGGISVGQATLGRLWISAPERVFTAPVMSRQLDARLGQFAWAGFDAPPSITAGQTVTVTLAWQAVGETDQDVKVFVHILDSHGLAHEEFHESPGGFLGVWSSI